MAHGTIVNGLSTWIDDEELAYVGYAGGMNQSRRRGAVLCADGKVRKAVLGVPNTFFSIPARVKAYGKTVSGYVSVDDDGRYVFTAYKYGKNHAILDKQYGIGDRVELHPATDEWMMGDRYGEVVGYDAPLVEGSAVRVKLDKSGKVRTVALSDLRGPA